ncbi:MAG: DUF192 domain-containing protein [Lentisphaeria bacterium]
MKFILPALLLFVVSFAAAAEKHYWPLEINKVLLSKIELAVNVEERNKGLMNRHSLTEEEGMLFVFPNEKVVSFWMKNTLVPLDIIFLDKTGKVIAFYSMPIEPPKSFREDVYAYESRLLRYCSKTPAKAVLELKAGMLEVLKIKKEMVLKLNLEMIPYGIK